MGPRAIPPAQIQSPQPPPAGFSQEGVDKTLAETPPSLKDVQRDAHRKLNKETKEGQLKHLVDGKVGGDPSTEGAKKQKPAKRQVVNLPPTTHASVSFALGTRVFDSTGVPGVGGSIVTDWTKVQVGITTKPSWLPFGLGIGFSQLDLANNPARLDPNKPEQTYSQLGFLIGTQDPAEFGRFLGLRTYWGAPNGPIFAIGQSKQGVALSLAKFSGGGSHEWMGAFAFDNQGLLSLYGGIPTGGGNHIGIGIELLSSRPTIAFGGKELTGYASRRTESEKVSTSGLSLFPTFTLSYEHGRGNDPQTISYSTDAAIHGLVLALSTAINSYDTGKQLDSLDAKLNVLQGAYARDENGNLILDSKGNPTLPDSTQRTLQIGNVATGLLTFAAGLAGVQVETAVRKSIVESKSDWPRYAVPVTAMLAGVVVAGIGIADSNYTTVGLSTAQLLAPTGIGILRSTELFQEGVVPNIILAGVLGAGGAVFTILGGHSLASRSGPIDTPTTPEQLNAAQRKTAVSVPALAIGQFFLLMIPSLIGDIVKNAKKEDASVPEVGAQPSLDAKTGKPNGGSFEIRGVF